MRLRARVNILILVGLLVGLPPTPAHAGTARPATAAVAPVDLGTLGGTSAIAYDIDGAGDIVGDSTTASGATHGFLYTAGTMIDIGHLADGTNSHLYGVNKYGATIVA